MKKHRVDYGLFNNQTCLLCRLHPAARHGLCEGCHADLPWLLGGCPRCAEPLIADLHVHCARCQQHPPAFDRTLAAFTYRFPLTELLPTIKYQRRPAALGWLGATLAELIADRLEQKPQLLLPVPMHPWQLFRRGFNQAALIAEILARELAIPYHDRLLRKTRNTSHQADLGRAERQANLRDSFACLGPVPPHVAIVDDVMTTGSTADELARLLRRQGAKQIDVWVLARTPG